MHLFLRESRFESEVLVGLLARILKWCVDMRPGGWVND